MAGPEMRENMLARAPNFEGAEDVGVGLIDQRAPKRARFLSARSLRAFPSGWDIIMLQGRDICESSLTVGRGGGRY